MPTYEESQDLLLQAETALSKIESDAEENPAQLAHAATAIKAVDVLLLQAGMAVMVCVSCALVEGDMLSKASNAHPLHVSLLPSPCFACCCCCCTPA